MGSPVDRERLGALLDDAIDRALGVPMRWGRNDCALWAGSILRRGLGYDPAAAWRKRYHSRTGAYRLARLGLPRELARAARAHGWRKIDPAEAQIGDVGFMLTGLGVATVLKYRGNSWVARTDKGVAFLFDRVLADGRTTLRTVWSVA